MAEYIERKALIQTIQKDPWIGAQGKDYALCDIAEQPTADVVEVRHGEWEEERWCDNFQHICSLCHKTVRVHPQSVAYKYCPYCGAKMDGKGDNNG